MGELGNFGIVGMLMNFVVMVMMYMCMGMFFGVFIVVCFMFMSYVFVYGDGSMVMMVDGGWIWFVFGQFFFILMVMSYVYEDCGIYLVYVFVRYVVEVDFGVGWFVVFGDFMVDGLDSEICIFEVYMVFVVFMCVENFGVFGC